MAQLATASLCELGTAQCNAVATRRTMLQRGARCCDAALHVATPCNFDARQLVMPLDEETTDTLSSTFSSFRFTGAAGEATGIFQRATRIINCAAGSRHRAAGSTHRATATAAQLHAAVLALQPSVPHLSRSCVSADSASVVYSNICVRRITYPNRPRTYTVHYFVSFRPPAASPIPAAASRRRSRCGTRHTAHDPPGAIPGYSTR